MDVDLNVVNVTWQNGVKDIRVNGKVKGPRFLPRLERGLRISLYPFPKHTRNLWIELSQAKIDPKSIESQTYWSNFYKATQQELNHGAELDTFKILLEAGAEEIGRKVNILNNTGGRKSFLCAVFDKNNSLFPVVVYVLTRVLTLMNEYTGNP